MRDCDGQVEEGFDVGAACAVTEGACTSAGAIARRCESLPHALRRPPIVLSTETCDGTDNDGDGEADEDFGAGGPCVEGVRACAAWGSSFARGRKM